MSSWYSLLITRAADSPVLDSHLRGAPFRSAVAQEGQDSVIAPEATETLDEQIAVEVATNLSRSINRPVLALHLADDAVLWYRLCDSTGVLDEYNSAPDYFDLHGEHMPPRPPIGGTPSLLANALLRPGSEDKVAAALHTSKLAGLTEEDFWSAVEANTAHELLCDSASARFLQLCGALGLPTWCVDFGFNAIARGETSLGREHIRLFDGIRPDA